MLSYIFEGKFNCLRPTVRCQRIIEELDMATVELNLVDQANFAQVALFMSVVSNHVANSKRSHRGFCFFF